MKRLAATLLWCPMVAIVFTLAIIGGVCIGCTALLIPAVRYLARVGDGE